MKKMTTALAAPFHFVGYCLSMAFLTLVGLLVLR